MHLTYRYRVKSLNGLLNRQARAVNFVWNYCNDRQKDAIKWDRRWLSAFDLTNLTAGSSIELGLHSSTVTGVCRKYVESRFKMKRPYLRYRGKRSLGWIPIKGEHLKRDGENFRFARNTFKVFSSRSLPDGKIKDGSCFSQDAKGDWYLNVVIEVEDVKRPSPNKSIGIDLGVKEFATFSNGEKIENPRHFRSLAGKLAVAQRAKKKRQARNVNSKIANARLDFHHKLSTRIVQEFDYIAVGNVNAAGLAKTSMAKSVLDAGWSSFRNMLRYKAITHGAWFEEVDERFTSQVCSSCGSKPESRPKGIADLGIRHWVCSDCGCSHDRDVNAALNILARLGHQTPVEGVNA